ncbi:hypothetical protein FRC07_000873, partial [Ceratobasidium sp. 392]
WTDGLRWGPCRVRDDFLFYHQRDTEADEDERVEGTDGGRVSPAKWLKKFARKGSVSLTCTSRREADEIPHHASSLSLRLSAPGASDQENDRLIKQTYSVFATFPDSGGQQRKWHITAYFTQSTIEFLRTVDQIPELATIMPPPGTYRSARAAGNKRTQEPAPSILEYPISRQVKPSPIQWTSYASPSSAPATHRPSGEYNPSYPSPEPLRHLPTAAAVDVIENDAMSTAPLRPSNESLASNSRFLASSSSLEANLPPTSLPRSNPPQTLSSTRPPSSRHVLTAALELAQEAVRIDSSGTEPLAAIAAYSKSVALLNEVMERVMRGEEADRHKSGVRRRSNAAREDEARRLKLIHDTYAKRMQILLLMYNMNSNQSPPLDDTSPDDSPHVPPTPLSFFVPVSEPAGDYDQSSGFYSADRLAAYLIHEDDEEDGFTENIGSALSLKSITSQSQSSATLMDHTTSGSQAPTSAAASSSAMTSVGTPSQSSQIIYMTPNHRVTKARYVTSLDPHGYVPVYKYPLNGQWIMVDTNDGYVLWTSIWKALGNSKADIVNILESQPDFASKLRRVRGGYLKMQGTWMAHDSPDQPGYGKAVTRPPAKPQRWNESINNASSPPVGSVALPYYTPVWPSAESGMSAQDILEPPVAGNTSMAFDFAELEGGVYVPEWQSTSPSTSHMQFGNQDAWSSVGSSDAVIKTEYQPGLYDHPSSQSTAMCQCEEPYTHSSPQHATPASSNLTHVVKQTPVELVIDTKRLITGLVELSKALPLVWSVQGGRANISTLAARQRTYGYN